MNTRTKKSFIILALLCLSLVLVSCGGVEQDTVYSGDGEYSGHILERFVDREYGVVCYYQYNYGVSCVKLGADEIPK